MQGSLKHLFTSFGRAICNLDKLAFLFSDSHALFKQLYCRRYISSSNQRIHGSFIDDIIKLMVFKGHLERIHSEPLHFRRKLFHLLDNSRTDINVDYILWACFVHLLGHFTIAAAHHENVILLRHPVLILKRILELRELRILIEVATCLVPFVPKVSFAVVIVSRLFLWRVLHKGFKNNKV